MLSIIGKGIHNILGEGKNGYKTVFFLLLRKIIIFIHRDKETGRGKWIHVYINI